MPELAATESICLADYHLAALFSWRQVHANAHAARTLPCPTPAGVKLALLAALVRRDGPARAEEHLGWLASLGVAWRPPGLLAFSTVTVRVWKGDENVSRGTESLTMNAAMREYVHWAGSLGLAVVGAPAQRRSDLVEALALIPALGTADSFVQLVTPPKFIDDLPSEYVRLDAGAPESPVGDGVFVLDDLGDAPEWERLSIFRPPQREFLPRLGYERKRRIVALPLRFRRREPGGYILERS